ncbi:uncharacterized protein LOC127863584 [Dreissena polymorpha]|nr:uncharacterized protein LOC127863584 [Dreissena polymorpha]
MGDMDFEKQIVVAMAAAISGLAVAIACVVAAIVYKRRKLKQRQKLLDANMQRGTSRRIQRNPSFNAQYQGISETTLSTDAPFIISGNLITPTSERVNPVYLDEDGLTLKRNQSLRLDNSISSIPRARVGDARKTWGYENDTDFGEVDVHCGNSMTANRHEPDSASQCQNRDRYDGRPTSAVTSPADAWFKGRLGSFRYMDDSSATGTDRHITHGTGRTLHGNPMLKRVQSTPARRQGQTAKENSAFNRNQSLMSRDQIVPAPQTQSERAGVHFYRANTPGVEQSDDNRTQFSMRRSGSLLWRDNRIGNFS